MRHSSVAAVAAVCVFTFACSGDDGRGTITQATCSDACTAIFACAAQLQYDLSLNGITQADCTADCESGTCGGEMNRCLASLACAGPIDAYGLGVLECGSASQCTTGLPLPVGACDTITSPNYPTGECVEYLGNWDLALWKPYCIGGMQGTWVSTCSTSGRAASCFRFSGDYGSRQIFYTSYPGSLDIMRDACLTNVSGSAGVWTTY
jgi:hypothetical protein